MANENDLVRESNESLLDTTASAMQKAASLAAGGSVASANACVEVARQAQQMLRERGYFRPIAAGSPPNTFLFAGVDHVRLELHTKDKFQFRCDRCGFTFEPSSEFSTARFIERCFTFVANHRGCKNSSNDIRYESPYPYR